MNRFGELRSLLHRPATSELFTRICKLYPDGEASEQELVYLRDHIARWDSAIKRFVPDAWVPDDLSSWPPLAELANSLDLVYNKLGDEGARAIATSTTLSNLQYLNLGWNHIGDEGARAIATSTTLSNLQYLNFRYNQLGAEGARAVSTLSNLQHLNLRSNYIGYEGARAIADSTTLSNLEYLDLRRNQIEDEAAQAIAKAMKRPGLTVLT